MCPARHRPLHGPGRVQLRQPAAESLFASLKQELLHDKRYTTVTQMRLDVFEWLTYYNTRRRHSAIGYQTPAGYEHQMITDKLATAA